MQKDIYGQFENTFMMYLPRLCEHCLNPSCVASCPSGSIYKREEDGIVLIDQDKCRGWRMCVSGCPYKKIYYNWTSGKAEKCIFCYPRIEAGQPTVCSETCVGRIRYLGVLLYDADGIEEAASAEDPQDLYEAQLALFLDPNDPEIAAQARAGGVPDAWIEAAKRSPTYKMAVEWRIAFPLHPEYRTLPMVWYVPPLSPIQSHANAGAIETVGQLPDVRSLRIPVRYLANLLTAGAEAPIIAALERMLGDAHLLPATPTWRGRWPGGSGASRCECRSGRGDASIFVDRQLRGSFRDPDQSSRAGRGRVRAAWLLRFHLRQWLRFRPAAFKPVRRQDGAPYDDADQAARHIRRQAMIVLRALGALFSYPREEVRQALPEIVECNAPARH